jgi:hypothetical protein
VTGRPASIDFAGEALQVATLKRRAHVRAVPICADSRRYLGDVDFG